jgi:hypothetical protein
VRAELAGGVVDVHDRKIARRVPGAGFVLGRVVAESDDEV